MGGEKKTEGEYRGKNRTPEKIKERRTWTYLGKTEIREATERGTKKRQ